MASRFETNARAQTSLMESLKGKRSKGGRLLNSSLSSTSGRRNVPSTEWDSTMGKRKPRKNAPTDEAVSGSGEGEVRGLPTRVPAAPSSQTAVEGGDASSQRLAAFSAQRKARHEKCLQEHYGLVRQLSAEYGAKVAQAAAAFHEQIGQSDDRLAATMSTLDDDTLPRLTQQEIEEVWKKVVDETPMREHLVIELDSQLEHLEMWCQREMHRQLDSLAERLIDIGYQLPESVQRLIEAERDTFLHGILDARRSVTDILTKLSVADVSRESHRRAQWVTRRKDWRQLKHNHALSTFTAIIKGPDIADPPARNSILANLRTQQRALSAQRLDLLHSMSHAEPLSHDAAKHIADALNDVSEQADALHQDVVAQLRDQEADIMSRINGLVATLTSDLVMAGHVPSKSVDNVVNDLAHPLVTARKAAGHDLVTSLDSFLTEQAKLARTSSTAIATFIVGIAKLRDENVKKQQNMFAKVNMDVADVQNNHDDNVADMETRLETELDAIRNEGDPSVLRKRWNEVVLPLLNDIENEHRQCTASVIKLAEAYPIDVARVNDKFDVSCKSFLCVSVDAPDPLTSRPPSSIVEDEPEAPPPQPKKQLAPPKGRGRAGSVDGKKKKKKEKEVAAEPVEFDAVSEVEIPIVAIKPKKFITADGTELYESPELPTPAPTVSPPTHVEGRPLALSEEVSDALLQYVKRSIRLAYLDDYVVRSQLLVTEANAHCVSMCDDVSHQLAEQLRHHEPRLHRLELNVAAPREAALTGWFVRLEHHFENSDARVRRLVKQVEQSREGMKTLLSQHKAMLDDMKAGLVQRNSMVSLKVAGTQAHKQADKLLTTLQSRLHATEVSVHDVVTQLNEVDEAFLGEGSGAGTEHEHKRLNEAKETREVQSIECIKGLNATLKEVTADSERLMQDIDYTLHCHKLDLALVEAVKLAEASTLAKIRGEIRSGDTASDRLVHLIDVVEEQTKDSSAEWRSVLVSLQVAEEQLRRRAIYLSALAVTVPNDPISLDGIDCVNVLVDGGEDVVLMNRVKSIIDVGSGDIRALYEAYYTQLKQDNRTIMRSGHIPPDAAAFATRLAQTLQSMETEALDHQRAATIVFRRHVVRFNALRKTAIVTSLSGLEKAAEDGEMEQRSELMDRFTRTVAKWQKHTKSHQALLTARLAHPQNKDEVDKLVEAEQKRFAAEGVEIEKCLNALQTAVTQHAHVFLDVIAKACAVLVKMFDQAVFVEELRVHDEQSTSQRQPLREMLKQRKRGSKPPTTPSTKKDDIRVFPKHVWPPLPTSDLDIVAITTLDTPRSDSSHQSAAPITTGRKKKESTRGVATLTEQGSEANVSVTDSLQSLKTPPTCDVMVIRDSVFARYVEHHHEATKAVNGVAHTSSLERQRWTSFWDDAVASLRKM